MHPNTLKRDNISYNGMMIYHHMANANAACLTFNGFLSNFTPVKCHNTLGGKTLKHYC